MKQFKLTGANEETIKRIEKFLKEIKFEETVKEVVQESLLFNIPWDETQTFKRYNEMIKNDKRT